MMKSILKPLIILKVMLFLTSCSQGLEGTWKVQKYQTNIAGEHNITLLDIGTMTFSDDGTGDKNINYSILGITKTDTSSFHWMASEEQITINSKNSEFGKTWIIIKDDRNYKKWKSTDGLNQIQILELVK